MLASLFRLQTIPLQLCVFGVVESWKPVLLLASLCPHHREVRLLSCSPSALLSSLEKQSIHIQTFPSTL